MSSTAVRIVKDAADAADTTAVVDAAEGTGKTADAPASAAAPLSAAELALPTWFFGFEGVLASAFDIIKAFPQAWPALLALAVVNVTVSLTMMKTRLKLAKALWRGKGTRKVAFGLIVLRLGSHFLLAALGFAVTSTIGHVVFAVAMAGITVALLAHCQRIAIRAVGAR